MSAGRPAEATPFADPTDTLLGWASRSELTFGEAMAAHPWFPAAGYTDDQLERTERLYGTFLARQVAAGAELSDLLGVTPSLACATLIARAGRLREPDASRVRRGRRSSSPSSPTGSPPASASRHPSPPPRPRCSPCTPGSPPRRCRV